MSNIWRPVDFDSLSSEASKEISFVEISSDNDNQDDIDLDSFGLPSGGK